MAVDPNATQEVAGAVSSFFGSDVAAKSIAAGLAIGVGAIGLESYGSHRTQSGSGSQNPDGDDSRYRVH